MKKFDGILMCTDLDGTLLRGDKTISRENKEAIEYFKSEGGLFTFITGRMPYYVSDMYEAINPNCPFGCVNGGGIYDHRRGEYLWTLPIDDSVRVLIEYIDKNLHDVGIQVSTFYKTYFSKDSEAMTAFRKAAGLPNIIRHYSDVTEPIAKILFADFKESNIQLLQSLLEAHPLAEKFSFIRSDKTLFEILPKGVDKGTLLVKMAELLGIDMKRTVAVGDYNNDVPMLCAAGLGVAVSNAVEAALAAADYVTVSNEEHAIAKIISELDLGKLII